MTTTNLRILPWSSIPWYLKIIRIFAYTSWFVLLITIIIAGAIYTVGVGQPGYMTGDFIHKYVLKGDTHYLTGPQSAIYEWARTVMIVTFPVGLVLFVTHAVFERKLKGFNKETGP